MIGQSLGPYQILAELGRGGMGEVYRARDTKLNRDVALKILPEAFATDPDRLARFRREAQVLASLNHPNIAAIYGFEDSGATHALVMELVAGPTLADRLAQGPLPLSDAWPMARQLADALEAAHEQGVIHRDLKPANIKVRDDGTVKVLDFGLAKALAPEAAGAAADAANSPTLTSPAMTAMGMILGTAAYMSPEQAKGRVADKRADIWAFGVVLYEMLAGRQLFHGDSVVETIGFVATRDPDWTALPASTPTRMRRLLSRCLARDPKERLRDIGEARIALAAPDDGDSAASQPAPVLAPRARRERTMWIGAAVMLAVLTGGAVWWFTRTPPVTNVVLRFNQPLPAGQTVTSSRAIAISPDGTKLAYIANRQIYLRGMDQLEAQPIRGSNENPILLVFSPDGQWLAYFVPPSVGAGPTLRKIAVTGGTSITLSPAGGIYPAELSWHGGTIVFAQSRVSSVNAIQTLADSGGTPQSIVSFDPAKERVEKPRLLDDGAHVLMTVVPVTATSSEDVEIVVQAIQGGRRTVLVRGGSDARLLSTGHLVYTRSGTLFAVAIDPKRFEVKGSPVPMVEGVGAQFDVADNGTLVFMPGGLADSPKRTLVWVDRQGREEPLSAKPRAYHHLRLSPDGKQIAVEIRDEEDDIWTWDLAREALTRLTIGPNAEGYPVWTHDGRHIIYRSDGASGTTILRRAADGTGSAEQLFHAPADASPQSLSRDDKHLVYRSFSAKTARDLMLLPLDPTGSPTPLIQTEFTEDNGQVSPDGRWIAYESNDSGARDVFVRPFPAVDTGKVPVSSGGGSFAKWSPDGRELFYVGMVSGKQALLSVGVPALPAGARFTSAKPQVLFPMATYLTGATQTYDVSLDGRRVLMVKEGVDTTPPPSSTTVVSHWFDELRARVKGN